MLVTPLVFISISLNEVKKSIRSMCLGATSSVSISAPAIRAIDTTNKQQMVKVLVYKY